MVINNPIRVARSSRSIHSFVDFFCLSARNLERPFKALLKTPKSASSYRECPLTCIAFNSYLARVRLSGMTPCKHRVVEFSVFYSRSVTPRDFASSFYASVFRDSGVSPLLAPWTPRNRALQLHSSCFIILL